MGRANTNSVSGVGRFNYRKKGRVDNGYDPERQAKGGAGIMPAELIIIDDRKLLLTLGRRQFKL